MTAYCLFLSLSQMLRPCCGFVADLLRIKSLMFNVVADVADFQTSYADICSLSLNALSQMALPPHG